MMNLLLKLNPAFELQLIKVYSLNRPCHKPSVKVASYCVIDELLFLTNARHAFSLVLENCLFMPLTFQRVVSALFSTIIEILVEQWIISKNILLLSLLELFKLC